jgi:hypothetical protein
MTAYADVSELANYLGLADNFAAGQMRTSGQQAKFEQALETASRLIDQDTSRTFEATAATKQIACNGGDTLIVPDLVSVTTLKVDDDADGTFEVTLTAADYELNSWNETDSRWPYEFIVRLDTWWPRQSWAGRRRLVEIAGTWGWSAVPAEIKQATLILAARLVQRSNAALGVQGVSDFGPFSIRTNDPDYQHLISRFVKVGVA